MPKIQLVKPNNLLLNVTPVPHEMLENPKVKNADALPEELVEPLAAGHSKSADFPKAFLRRAGLAQSFVNCITGFLLERAIARAEHLDAYLAEHRQPTSPLHGLPVSVKRAYWLQRVGS